jgi:chromosomal replication initiator protein
MNISSYVSPGIKREFVPSTKILRRMKISTDEILDIVANNCNVKGEEIKSQMRNGEIVEARHITCAIMRNEFDYSLKYIGKELGGRDHTTIIHSLRTFRNRMDVEEGYRELFEKIKKDVNNKVDSNYSKRYEKEKEKSKA